jgi:antitoxin component of MazEF toxin-antitoxin module
MILVGFVGRVRRGGTTVSLVVTVPHEVVEALNLREDDYLSCEEVVKLKGRMLVQVE